MKISLIVATRGRSVELRRLFTSLVGQSWNDLELIVVDQNVDDRAKAVVEEFEDCLLIRRITSEPGASRARNAGLAVATGDVIGFPDDDCWYPDGVLTLVSAFLDRSPEWDGVIGHTVDESGGNTLPWGEASGRLTPAMSWRRAVTYVYFLRRRTALGVGGFDTTLGPGAGTSWGAGDDNDYLLRTLENGAQVFFDSELKIHHPPLFQGYDDASLAKRLSYARADGRVLRKHPMPLWWRAAFFGVPLVRLCLSLPVGNAARVRFHWITFRGRLSGFFDEAPA